MLPFSIHTSHQAQYYPTCLNDSENEARPELALLQRFARPCALEKISLVFHFHFFQALVAG